MDLVLFVEYVSEDPAILAVLITLLTLTAGMFVGWIRKPQWAERWAHIGVVIIVILLVVFVYRFNSLSDSQQVTPDRKGAGEVLVDENGIVIRRVGDEGTLEVKWDEVSVVEFDAYSVDFYGISPVTGWYNVGYHYGHEFETVRYTSPYDDFFKNQADYGQSFQAERQLWRVCVAPSKYLDNPEHTVTLIEEYMRCTSPFRIPHDQSG